MKSRIRIVFIYLLLASTLSVKSQNFHNVCRMEAQTAVLSFNQSVKLDNGNIGTVFSSTLDSVYHIVNSTSTQVVGAEPINKPGSVFMVKDSNQNFVKVHKWIPMSNPNVNNDYFYIPSVNKAPDGSIYLGGRHAGQVDFNPGVGTDIGGTTGNGSEAFFIKLNSAGDYLWNKRIQLVNSSVGLADIGNSIIGAGGNLWSVGRFRASVDFDPGTGTSILSAPTSTSDGFILVLDTAGNFVSVKEMEGAELGNIQPLAAGGKLITGKFDVAINVEINGGTPVLLQPGSGFVTFFLAAYDNADNLLWSKPLYGYNSILTEIDANGDVYVFSAIEDSAQLGNGVIPITRGGSDLVLQKFNGNNGNEIWTHMIQGSAYENAYSLKWSNNACYVTYSYIDSLDIPAITPDTSFYDPNKTQNFGMSVFHDISNSHLASYTLNPDSIINYGQNLIVSGSRVDFSLMLYGAADLDPGTSVTNYAAPIYGRHLALISWYLDPLSFPVALDDRLSDENWVLYPNPTTGMLNLQMTDRGTPVEVQLMDMSGRVLVKSEIQYGEGQLDMADLSAGLYLVQVQVEGEMITKKVVKE